MKKNIILIYIFSFFFNFYLDLALISVYITDKKGFSVAYLGFFQVIFMVMKLIFEVPTGTLSDYFGRVKILSCATIFIIFSNIAILFGKSAFPIIISYVFFGISLSLAGGTLESLLFDSLLSINKESEYKKIYSNLYVVIMISMSIAVILGGLVSYINMDYMYYGNIITLVFALITSFFLKEPTIVTRNSQTFSNIINNAANILRGNSNLIYYITFATITLAISKNTWLLSQKLLSLNGLSYMEISYEAVFTCLATGIAAMIGFKIERKLKIKYYSFFIILITVLPLILLALTKNIFIMLFMLTLLTMIEGFTDPIFSDYINSEISSSSRTTILSIRNLISGIFGIFFTGLLGFTNDISYTFLIVGLTAIPVYFGITRKMVKKK